MKTRKKTYAILIFCVLTVLLTVGIWCSCKKDKSETEDEDLTEITVETPALDNLEVDVSDKPTAWFIGDYTLQKIEIDGILLNGTDYKINNRYCILKTEYYFDLGVGVHSVKITFNEGVYEFTISVKDSDVFGEDLYDLIVLIKDNDVCGDDLYDNVTD